MRECSVQTVAVDPKGQKHPYLAYWEVIFWVLGSLARIFFTKVKLIDLQPQTNPPIFGSGELSPANFLRSFDLSTLPTKQL